MIATDLSMTGVSHVYFNSAFVRMLYSIVHKPIIFYGEKAHCENLKDRLVDLDVYYKSFQMKTRLGAGIFLQDFRGCILLLKIFLTTPRNERLFILNRLPFTLILCNLVNLFAKREIYNVMHGELEYLVNPKVTGLTKYYYKFFKLAYLMSTKRNYNIFLGQSIYDETIKKGIRFGKSKHLIIDHPYDYDFPDSEISPNFSDKINVGMTGTATRRKNSHYMVLMRPLLVNSLVNIQNIGRAEKELYEELEKAGVSYFRTNIPGEEYERLVSQLDYSLCFYDNSINLALASGSFFDSIKFAKPILALKGNPYVDYYFEKLGNIGYQFDSISDMSIFLNHLTNDEIKNYRFQVEMLHEAQKALSIENITKQLKKQIYI